jgi:hypothetical protein
VYPFTKSDRSSLSQLGSTYRNYNLLPITNHNGLMTQAKQTSTFQKAIEAVETL